MRGNQFVKLHEIYFWMQNINLYMGLSVCNTYTILEQKSPYYMMTSSNGNIFRVTGPLRGDFTGRRRSVWQH